MVRLISGTQKLRNAKMQVSIFAQQHTLCDPVFNNMIPYYFFQGASSSFNAQDGQCSELISYTSASKTSASFAAEVGRSVVKKINRREKMVSWFREMNVTLDEECHS